MAAAKRRKRMSTTGQAAENLAADFLARNGLRLLARNYRCRGGEVDLVADDRGTLVFVEVRLRSNTRFGGAGASITATKRQRLIRAAQHYLAGKPERPCRFDALLLERLDARSIEWIRDAFGTD